MLRARAFSGLKRLDDTFPFGGLGEISMSDAVLYESDGRVATITLNRPENRNSMTSDVLEGFRESIARARSDGGLRAVVITGRGASFCAGADFRSAN
ncbi:MAG: enoyl-CoA hydratase/isomerase family protein, partial [Candidatus Binatia bacterium]